MNMNGLRVNINVEGSMEGEVTQRFTREGNYGGAGNEKKKVLSRE